MLPRVRHVLFWPGQIETTQFIAGLLPQLTGIKFARKSPADFDACGVPGPAFLPALGEFPGIPRQRIDVDSKRSLAGFARPEHVVYQLQIRSAGLAKSLAFQGFAAAFWTVHFA